VTERIAIVGSRPEYDPRQNGRLTESSIARRKAVFDYVEALAKVTKDITIVTGGAPGVDQWAAGSGAAVEPRAGFGAAAPRLAPTQLVRGCWGTNSPPSGLRRGKGND
jgi:hypothetical protein